MTATATMYSNPRLTATIDGWPYGQMRSTALFSIEPHPTRGERGVRILINPKTGQPCAPKKLTFARQARIVDGDDGRTYIAELSLYGSIHIMRSDMQVQHEYVGTSDPRYATLRALFSA